MTDNITPLPPRKKKEEQTGPVEIAYGFGGCQHSHVEVCEKESEVTCRDCKAKLNPIWVLMRIAQDDRILVDRWASLRAEIELMRQKMRVKCRHCKQFTPVPSGVRSSDLFNLAHKLKREKR